SWSPETSFNMRPTCWESDGPSQQIARQELAAITSANGKARAAKYAESNKSHVSDAMEEKLDDLCQAAGDLGVPAFMFQEGDDLSAEQAFREIARLTHGAYCRFDPGAAHQLAELLRAVAAYAAGGMKALAAVQHNAGAARLLLQLR